MPANTMLLPLACIQCGSTNMSCLTHHLVCIDIVCDTAYMLAGGHGQRKEPLQCQLDNIFMLSCHGTL